MSHTSELMPRLREIPVNRTAWWQQSLAREITLILVLKVILITLLWWAFFHVPDTRRIHTPQVSAHVVGPALSPLHPSEETPK